MNNNLSITGCSVCLIFLYFFRDNNLCLVVMASALLLTVFGICYLYERKIKKILSKFFRVQELSQVRGMFVNIASHELRNPMTTIYSSVDLLENYGGQLDVNEKMHLFENVRKSIRRMTKMMDDIVLIGRLQHQQIGYNPKPTNILQFCSTIAEMLEQEKNAKRIHIIMDHSVDPIISIDQSLLDHILSNLLSNALKYSEDYVKLQIKIQRSHIIFDVIDRGIGIPLNEIRKLSQLFSRGSNIGVRKGIGIGMYLTSHCVKLHRGTMKVFSRENQGTHFRIILPIKNV